MADKRLSKEAADELVRYLCWLIDEVQFSQGYPEKTGTETRDSNPPDRDFDDPIPSG
jgi:hypothetical protein